MNGEHWGPEEVAWLRPEDELEDIELGFRVGWWLLMWQLAFGFSDQASRDRSVLLTLMSEVAEATSHRGLPFPAEWWPADAGPLPVAP